jgi:hypothetical protein
MADQVTFNALRALDADGNPVAGAKAYFYETGTTTPVTVYTDTALSVAAASPLVADANGYFDQVFYNGSVSLKVVVDDADDVELFTLDPVATVATASAAASGITFTPTSEIAQSNVQDAIEQVQSNVDDAKTGADDGIVTGTAGSANHLAKWNGDGDLVDHGVAPTAGRILYGNGTNWVALDIGTASQVLKVNSAATAPEWVTDAFDSGTETSVANVDISIPAGAKRVVIEVSEFAPASDGENLQIRCGNGGVDTGASDYSSFNVILSTGASGSDTTAAAILATWGGSGADTGETTSTVIDVLSPRDSSRRTYFHCRSLGLTTAGALEGGISGGRRNTAQDDDTIRLFASNGNIATITYVARAFY